MAADAAAGGVTESGGSRRMWGGRFVHGPTEAMAALNNSLPVDRRMWRQDIRASKAWVNGLRRAGVLDTVEEVSLLEGLDRVAERIAAGEGADAADEDIHSLVERLLFEEVGDVAGKLHTGRSRNDQVSTDLRLWCLEVLDAIRGEVVALGRVLVRRAREGAHLILPGYTHGQQAQPVRWGYVLLAHTWPLVRDLERLEGVRRRVSALPLGSGAVAGSSVPVDRGFLRDALGFETVCANALDATGDRDFVADMIFAVTMIATHLSRLGAELVTYSSTEYGFVRLADGYSTGSSLMPQKRNPDVFELARARSSRLVGDLVGVLGTLQGLPAGYSKDLQEDKPHLFDAVDTVLVTLPAVRGAVETLEPVPERMEGALQDALFATDVADGLVHRGIPFREAHGLAGRLVALAEGLGVGIRDVPADQAAPIHPDLPAVVRGLGTFVDSVERRVTEGSTGLASVEAQLAALDGAF